MKQSSKLMAARRQAHGRRPLLRRGGGAWLQYGIEWCAATIGMTQGELITATSKALGYPRDRLYKVMRRSGGMSPDALWSLGWTLRDLGVWWMSGPLALALEPKYDAHLLGVVAEVLLEPRNWRWVFSFEDIVTHRDDLRRLLQDDSEESYRRYVAMVPEQVEVSKAAWSRWYATTPGQLRTKEDESRFLDSAPSFARAITLLREHQREDDPPKRGSAYHIPLRSLDKEIMAFFQGNRISGAPEARTKPSQPRLENVIAKYMKSDVPRRTRERAYAVYQALGKPKASQVKASGLYACGWRAREQGSELSWMSGLTALALFDCERDYYYALATILRDVHQVFQRPDPHRSLDCATARRFKKWWPSLTTITALIGPTSRGLWEMSEEVASMFSDKWRVSVAELREALLSDTPQGRAIREMVTVPDDLAHRFGSFRSIPKPRYETDKVPAPLAAVIDSVEGNVRMYPPDNVRIEFSWWLKHWESYLDVLAGCRAHNSTRRA